MGTTGQEGTLVDIDTGVVRHDHLLVQHAVGAIYFFGFGRRVERLQRFAFTDDDGDADPFFARCRLIADAVENNSPQQRAQLGIPDWLAEIEDRTLRRLAIAEALAKAGYNPDEPRDARGRWTTAGGSVASSGASVADVHPTAPPPAAEVTAAGRDGREPVVQPPRASTIGPLGAHAGSPNPLLTTVAATAEASASGPTVVPAAGSSAADQTAADKERNAADAAIAATAQVLLNRMAHDLQVQAEMAQFRAAGFKVVANVYFLDPRTNRSVVADYVVLMYMPDPATLFISQIPVPILARDVKTGGGRMSENQQVTYPYMFNGGSVIPVGANAVEAGFEIGRSTEIRALYVGPNLPTIH
jgi:hypothetical protein